MKKSIYNKLAITCMSLAILAGCASGETEQVGTITKEHIKVEQSAVKEELSNDSKTSGKYIEGVKDNQKSNTEINSEKEETKTQVQTEPKVESENKQTNIEQSKKEEPKAEVKEEPKKQAKVEVKEEPKKQETKPQIVESPISGNFMSEVSLNIRSGHNVNSNKVGSLIPYEKAVATAKVVENGVTWYKIKYKNIEGWASASYLKEYKENAKPKETVTNNAQSKSTQQTQYKPNHIYYSGKAVPYKNVGLGGTNVNGGTDGTAGSAQATIDKTKNAATFGGAATFSGNDGLNTHFIGHNPGQFSGMHNASTFVITDASGKAYTYQKTALYVVDENAVRTSDGANMWDRIVGTGGGERIVLQSTKKHPYKYIVEAVLVK